MLFEALNNFNQFALKMVIYGMCGFENAHSICVFFSNFCLALKQISYVSLIIIGIPLKHDHNGYFNGILFYIRCILHQKHD